MKTLIGGLCMAVLLSAASDTRLSDAAMQGNQDAVRSLLKQRVDVNAPQGDGTTALHWAAYRDDLEMVKLLLAAGANAQATTREGAITPLLMACQNGNVTIIEAIVKAGADVNAVKSNGTTPLMMAAASGSANAVETLLAHGANVNAKELAHGQTALMFAAALNRAAAIKILMANGADASVATNVRKLERVRFDQDGNVVEEKAPQKGAEKAEPGAAKSDEAAAQQENAEQAKAREQAEAAQRSDLDVLAHALAFKSVEYRLSKPQARAGDVANRPPRKVGADFMGGMTALIYAAREGHMDALRALVEAGTDINQVNGD